MRKKLLRAGVLSIGVLTLAMANWAVASKPSEGSGVAATNPDGDRVCNSGSCTDVETGPVVKATGPFVVTSPTTATLQLTCYPPHPGGQVGPTGDCRGPVTTYMNGVLDSKNYVHLAPNVPTTITLDLTSAGQATVAAAWAGGPGQSKGTCPIKAVMKDNDNGPKTTISHEPDFVVG